VRCAAILPTTVGGACRKREAASASSSIAAGIIRMSAPRAKSRNSAPAAVLVGGQHDHPLGRGDAKGQRGDVAMGNAGQ
jgi:hypothetical protein